jgi:hypothetical protein
MATAGSEAAGDEAPHCDSGTLPARVGGGDGTVQVELGRRGGLASEAVLIGGGWRRGSTEGGGAHAAARERRRESTEGGGAHAAARQRRRARTRSDNGAWSLRTEAHEAVAVGRVWARRLSGRRRRGRGGRCRAGAVRRALSGGRGQARQLSGRVARSGFKPRRWRGM